MFFLESWPKKLQKLSGRMKTSAVCISTAAQYVSVVFFFIFAKTWKCHFHTREWKKKRQFERLLQSSLLSTLLHIANRPRREKVNECSHSAYIRQYAASISHLPCSDLLFRSCSQICSQRPAMFIVTSSAFLWFVKQYDLLMKEDANIASVVCCGLHSCHSFKTLWCLCV